MFKLARVSACSDSSVMAQPFMDDFISAGGQDKRVHGVPSASLSLSSPPFIPSLSTFPAPYPMLLGGRGDQSKVLQTTDGHGRLLIHFKSHTFHNFVILYGFFMKKDKCTVPKLYVILVGEGVSGP